MSSEIHPTAIIESGAVLGCNVTVGPYAYIGGNVRLGDCCRIAHRASVLGNTTMGDGNVVHSGAIIGGEPQDLKYSGEDSRLIIGAHNVFREAVTVNSGTATGCWKTVLGDNNLLMAYVHVAHDCILEDNIVLSNSVQLAGHIKVECGAIMGGISAAHHFTTIGKMSFVGGLSAVRMDVPPYMIVEGIPARVQGINRVGLKRNNITEAGIVGLKELYRIVYRSKMNRSQAVEKVVNSDLIEVAEVKDVVESFKRSEQGRFGRSLEGSRTTDIFASTKKTETARVGGEVS